MRSVSRFRSVVLFPAIILLTSCGASVVRRDTTTLSIPKGIPFVRAVEACQFDRNGYATTRCIISLTKRCSYSIRQIPRGVLVILHDPRPSPVGIGYDEDRLTFHTPTPSRQGVIAAEEGLPPLPLPVIRRGKPCEKGGVGML